MQKDQSDEESQRTRLYKDLTISSVMSISLTEEETNRVGKIYSIVRYYAQLWYSYFITCITTTTEL